MSALRSSFAALAIALMLSACTPQQTVILALMPHGAASTLLGNLQRVGADNRRQVVELDAAGRWDELVRLADKNLQRDKSNADWWIVKGYAQTQSGEHRAAIQSYGEAVRIEPDSALAWNQLAQSHRAAGDPQRAIVVLERAQLAVRDSPTTAYLLGESYSDIRRFEEAAAAYRQALGLDPRLAVAWYGLSRSYTRMGREREARESRDRLAKLDPALARRLDADIGPAR